MPPPEKENDQRLPPPPPTKPPGIEKFGPVYGCCLFLGLGLIGWGVFGYIQAGWVSDFSSWEPATCHLESVQTITTHTSWDPLGILDPQRLNIHATWGLGVYAIVRVNVTVPEGDDPRIFRSEPMIVVSSLTLMSAVVTQPVGKHEKATQHGRTVQLIRGAIYLRLFLVHAWEKIVRCHKYEIM